MENAVVRSANQGSSNETLAQARIRNRGGPSTSRGPTEGIVTVWRNPLCTILEPGSRIPDIRAQAAISVRRLVIASA